MQTQKEMADLFKVLADESRLQIIDMLSHGELNCRVILRSLNIRQPTLSYHLKTLSDHQIITGRHEAPWIFYSLNKGQIKNIIDYLQQVVFMSQFKVEIDQERRDIHVQ